MSTATKEATDVLRQYGNTLSSDVGSMENLSRTLVESGASADVSSMFQKAMESSASINQATMSSDNPMNYVFDAVNYLQLDEIEDHDVKYEALYALLQRAQHALQHPLDQVTHALLLAYIHTHLLTPTTTTQSFSFPDGVTRGSSSSCSSSPDSFMVQFKNVYYEMVTGATALEVPAKDKFMVVLAGLVYAQFQTHYNRMHQDAVLRVRYALNTTQTLAQMYVQQKTSITLLRQLLDYVNDQVGEYSEVYERLNTLMDTQKRKSTFLAADVQTLDRWQVWCRAIFWFLVVFFVLMVLVDHYTDLSRFTADMDSRVKQAASSVGV